MYDVGFRIQGLGFKVCEALSLSRSDTEAGFRV